MSTEAKQCPWCMRWALKDNACDYIFSCGLDVKLGFIVGAGCGKTWCWRCGKKFCGQYHDPVTGAKMNSAKDNHDVECCTRDPYFKREDFCAGGCSSHCSKRW
jgi:hypothetical protein